MIDHIQWLGHGSFLIQSQPIIYINPWRVVRNAFHADVILIGHDHYDHCSVADVTKLCGPATRIIGNEKVAALIPQTEVLRAWQSINVERARITAVPAYSPGDLRHPLTDGGLGFLISLNFYDIYYAGDTMLIPEMQRLHPDIAILPIDADGTLSVEEAVAAVGILRPRYVLPANWGAAGEGAAEMDARMFKKQVGGRAQVILPEDRPSGSRV
ncbi:MAG: MBL fold metallo-hydrolase [Anaerolineae bacterium]|nr:MBL fold metallo-hydrolase [Anaerolineae bacterium]